MKAVQGALIVASSIQIVLGYSQIWAICSRYKLYLLINKQVSIIFFISYLMRESTLLRIGSSARLEWFRLFPWWVLACLIEASPWYSENYHCHYSQLLIFSSFERWKQFSFRLTYSSSLTSLNTFQVGKCVEIGIPMLILFVIFSQVLLMFLM